MEEFPLLPHKHYDDLRHKIRSGDILLCSGNSTFSTLIQKATGSVWSHVGFILCVDPIDRIMVLESVESIGVRTIPLSNYVRDYNGTHQPYPGRLMLARHQDVKEKNIAKLSRTAVDLFGYPYGTDEIIRIAARISLFSLGLANHEKLMPQKEFICSEYAHVCFKSIGIDIDYNPMGFIAPVDFAKHPRIKPMWYMGTESPHVEPVWERKRGYV